MNTVEQRRKSLAINAVGAAIGAFNRQARDRGWTGDDLFVPLSLRVKIAESVLAELDGPDTSARPAVPAEEDSRG